MPLTGAWVRRYQQSPEVPLVAPTDPEHTTPTDNQWVGGATPSWQNTAPAPDLPAELYPAPAPGLPTGEGPVAYVSDDPLYGPGSGHGLTELEGQDQMLPWHLADDGSVAAEKWAPMVDRDGTPEAQSWESTPLDGDSPSTPTLYLRTGVGTPIDPDARQGRRFWRWYNRTIDFHRWDTERGPVAPQYAHPQAETPPGGDQITSPFSNVVGYSPGAPDRFVNGFERRAPAENWNEPFEGDGTMQTLGGATNNYGLTAWGM